MDQAGSRRQRGARPAAARAQAMSNTNIVTIGIDLGKNAFHVVGLDAQVQSRYTRSGRETRLTSRGAMFRVV